MAEQPRRRTSPQALRAHDRRVAGMLTDPECVGELLLVGIAMARSVDFDDPPCVDGAMPMGVIAQRVYGARRLPPNLLLPGNARGDTRPRARLRDVFHADRRRYDPAADGDRSYHAVTCGRPMIRREGLCDRAATDKRRLTDPATGRRQYVGCCSQPACRRWFADLVERNRAELAASPPPVPPANTGGVLERHIPEVDWWAVWRSVDSKWTPPPEGRAFERPTLTLVEGDLPPGATSEPARRPVLTVLPGGWR